MGTKKVSSNKQFITNYLDSLELKAFKTNHQFWSHLESRHDEKVLDQLDDAFIARAEGTNEEEVYVIKNQNLRLSLDVANFSTDLYQRYFEWFMNRKENEPKKILDVGCDNGIVTCFYALLFPQSEVIGIDIQKNAIRCSTELAEKLNLTNVTFLKLDLTEINEQIQDHSFDLITSVRSFHEIIGEFPEPPKYQSKDDLLEMNVHYDNNHLLSVIKNLLHVETSEFITIERLVGIGSLLIWAKALENANLHIKWGESSYIDFHELGMEQQMPVLVTGGQHSDLGILEGVDRIITKDNL
jgi:SAM-dependent methyltransferase